MVLEMIEAFFSNYNAVSGAILLACFVAYLAWRNGYKARVATASASFRTAFAGDLAVFESGSIGDRDPMDYLRDAYPKHLEAVFAFSPFILNRHRRSFDADWNRYRYGEQEDGSPQTPETAAAPEDGIRFLEYSFEWHRFKPQSARDLAVKRMRKLLTYAEQT